MQSSPHKEIQHVYRQKLSDIVMIIHDHPPNLSSMGGHYRLAYTLPHGSETTTLPHGTFVVQRPQPELPTLAVISSLAPHPVVLTVLLKLLDEDIN